MEKNASNALMIIFGIIAIASLCISGYALMQLNDHNDSDDTEIFDAEAYYDRVKGYADTIKKQTDIVPEVAIVLGSGLGSFVDGVDIHTQIPYASLEGFPVSTVSGHEGNFILGTMGGKNIILMQGRVHYYEGYSSQEVVLPLRVMHELGANTVIITNAVGTLNYDFQPGTFMLVQDHICLAPSPLIGENISELGKRFTPMNYAYDTYLAEIVKDIAMDHGYTMNRGTFIQTTGPQYETPAEIKMYRQWGADTVGMSTAVEVIAAAHCGMKVCNINCITNMGAGMGGAVPTHDEVKEMSKRMASELVVILNELIPRINEKP